MANTSVQLKTLDSGVAVITIDLPDSKVNLLSGQVMMELASAVDSVKSNPAVKGLVIRSGKSDNFVAGANIGEIQALQNQPEVKAYEASKLGKQLLSEIDRLPFRVVALVNGTCLGGGTELSLACDERLLVDNPKTQIGVPEVKLGFIPGWGGTVRLTRLLGIQKALELVTTGKTLDAKRAWKCGLASEVVSAEAAEKRAEAVALGAKTKRYNAPLKAKATKWALEGTRIGRSIVRSMAMKAIMAETRGKYPAPIDAVKVIFAAATGPADKAFDLESEAFARLAVTRVSKNLVGIFFAQQESKKAPSGATCQIPIKKVGVLGAGVMGSGIAQASAYAGYQVVMYDLKPDALEKGMKNVKSLFDGLVEKGKLTREEADKRYGAIKATGSYADMADCDFVIEAVPESMYLKRLVRSELEKVISKPFIFATNTSSLVVSEMTKEHVPAPGREGKEKNLPAARNPENVVGVHFFNPVHKMLLVEVIRGAQTSDSALACAIAFGNKLGKTTVIAKDSAGFLVNRILFPYLREAMVLMVEGVSIVEIDRAMKAFGMPMGPGELLDAVGLDIAGEVIRVGRAAFGERLAPPDILKKIEELKLLGKKGGKGIYLYDEKTGKRGDVNPDVLAALTAAPKAMTATAIQDRLALAMVNEAALCMAEGIVSDAGQLDLAMIFGTGFPPFLGGPLRYADELGAEVVRQKLEWLHKVAGDNYKPAALLCKKAAGGETFYAADAGKEELSRPTPG
jgi:3-hydroxyacyl-CoA dehydrogenase/enoyl-CoA hydratase/3-hydroxybutyryl-CoA epimerase